MVADHLPLPYQDPTVSATTRLQLLEMELRMRETYSASMESVIQQYDRVRRLLI